MCNLEEPRAPGGGPALCDKAKELIIASILEGETNSQIRAALKRAKHVSKLSDNAFSLYRKQPLVNEARRTALVNIKDIGVVSLSRRVEKLNDAAEMCFLTARTTHDNKERALLIRTAVRTCQELSRLVDLVDPDGTDGIPNGPTEDAPREITIAQVLRVMRSLTAQKRLLTAPRSTNPEMVGNAAEHPLQSEKEQV